MVRRIYENKYLLPIIIAIVVAVSSVGVLDEYSDNYTTDSIVQAGASYAIARGINAAVSVLQTTTVEGGGVIAGVSMTIGEILDPVNDLIERFSYVMSLALGSLVLQKILLGISAHAVFKILIAAFGFMLIASLITRKKVLISWSSRIFLLLIFVRFALVMVVTFNSIVDGVFISTQITSSAERLSEFQDEIMQLENNNIGITAHKESIRDDLSSIDNINTTILPDLEKKLVIAKNQLIEAELAFDEIQNGMEWKDRWNPFYKHTKAIKVKEMIASHEQQVEALQIIIEEQEKIVDKLLDDIEISEKRAAGEPVGAWEKIKNVVGIDYVTGLNESLSLDAIGESITETTNNIILLSALFVLKAILIPLVFFFVFIMGVKGIWKADLIGIFYNEEKLATERQ